MQETKWSATYDRFKINDEYHSAVPRPTDHEYSALEWKILERGQQEPIVVNENMVILDGHTRYDIMSQRGMEIKYIVRKFANEKEEMQYVVESNVMRRQLTNYARLESVRKMYDMIKSEPQSRRMDTWAGIFKAVDEGKNTVKEIEDVLGHNRVHINMSIKEMEKEHYVKIEKKWTKYDDRDDGRGGMRNFISLLPKGKEFLSKYKPRQKGGANVLIGKITGCDRTVVAKAMVIMDKCDDTIKQKLRKGSLSISGVYEDLLGGKRRKSSKYTASWSKYAKIKCPHCKKIAEKQDYEVIGEKKYKLHGGLENS